MGGIVLKNWIHGSVRERIFGYQPMRKATGIEQTNAAPKPMITRCSDRVITLKYRQSAFDSEIRAIIPCFGLAKKVLIVGINVIKNQIKKPPIIEIVINIYRLCLLPSEKSLSLRIFCGRFAVFSIKSPLPWMRAEAFFPLSLHSHILCVSPISACYSVHAVFLPLPTVPFARGV